MDMGSMDWERYQERSCRSPKKQQVTCFNARIDFLNNLSEGIVKKFPKQRKNSSSRELEMPLPPGCFPQKVSLALSKSSASLSGSSNTGCNNNTMSTTMESLASPPSVADKKDLMNRVDSWYTSLNKSPLTTDEGCTPELPPKKNKAAYPKMARNRQLDGVKRQLKGGSSLKLQNGSYPVKYSARKKEEEEKLKEENEKNKKNKKTVAMEKNNNEIVDLDESIISDDGCLNTDTLSSELYDPLSDKIEDPFSRSSSRMSKSPSISSEQNSVFSIDSTYGTSEFSTYSSKGNIGSTPEQERLANVLEHIDAEVLREQLKLCLSAGKPRLTKSLSALLPRNKFKGKTSHCLRCHGEYDKRHGTKTCVLRHPNEDVVLISEDGENALFQCERCACVFKLDGSLEYNEDKTDVMNSGACFIGQHTNTLDHVEYAPRGFAQTCSETGCAIFYV